MKLLFVVDKINSNQDANINLVKNILPELSKHEVFFIGNTLNPDEVEHNVNNKTCFYWDVGERIREFYVRLNDAPWKNKLEMVWQNMRITTLGALKLARIEIEVSEYKEQIENLCKEINPDAVIAISAPFYTAKAVSSAKIKAKKIIWMFDPYASHYLMGGIIPRLQEKICFAKADKIFVPELLKGDYKAEKVEAMPFPGVVELPNVDMEVLQLYPQKHNTINFAFVGSLYANIRNPYSLFALLEKISDLVRFNKKIHLTIVGGMYGEFSEEFNQRFGDFMSKHVTFTGTVSKETAIAYMQKADVLVNIGNSIENQLPSKIYEYFSTGKPILNIKQIVNCPSSSIVGQYPVSITVDAQETYSTEIAYEIILFLQKNVGRKLEYKTVKAIFEKNTAKSVAKKLLENI